MRFILFGLLSCLLVCCNSHKKNSADYSSYFNAIDSITGTENWRWISGADTSYYYFSRIGDQKINVYRFNIQQGDSVNTQLTAIDVNDDVISWPINDKHWELVSARNGTMVWASPGAMDTLEFKRIDSSHLISSITTGEVDTLKKTLPLSTFLVRAKYDYEHGTNYVDSALVPPKISGK